MGCGASTRNGRREAHAKPQAEAKSFREGAAPLPRSLGPHFPRQNGCCGQAPK
jgi:hypothetical protein